MRELKFRTFGITGMNKTFTLQEISTFIQPNDGSHLIERTWQDNIIFMQYTGLKDKNRVEIYDSDIIQSLYSDGSPCRHIVKWVDSEARFMIFDLKTDRECGSISNGWIHVNNKEVIGNIHQNPELLK